MEAANRIHASKNKQHLLGVSMTVHARVEGDVANTFACFLDFQELGLGFGVVGGLIEFGGLLDAFGISGIRPEAIKYVFGNMFFSFSELGIDPTQSHIKKLRQRLFKKQKSASIHVRLKCLIKTMQTSIRQMGERSL